MHNAPQAEDSNFWKDEQAAVGARSSRRRPFIYSLFLIIPCVAAGIFWIGRAEGRGSRSANALAAGRSPASGQPAVDSGVFSPAHSSWGERIRDFFDLYPTPVQPIAFNHQLHIAKGMKCTACHAGVTRGPDAAIPSVTFCMACHQVIASDKPEIKKLAAYAAKGQDVPWQPVNWFYPAAHVRFWHAPHISAGVGCSTCHGDMTQKTVAVRQDYLTMNFCLNCHREKGASVDCTTCHY